MLPMRKQRIRYCKNKIDKLTRCVAASRKEYDRKTMQDRYLSGLYSNSVIDDCIMQFGLNLRMKPHFVAWPAYLGTCFDDINISAVNFGALVIYDRNQKDKSASFKYINAAINTLVVTNMKDAANSSHRYWPAKIDITNRAETGTLNQTTLSLSSLLRFGFLDASTISQLKPKQQHNRYQFIVDNLNWILSLQTEDPDNTGAWSYAEKCKEITSEDPIETAILPSQFCYEVISKYYKFFSSDGERKNLVNSLDRHLLPKMLAACTRFEKWIHTEQNEDGGFVRNCTAATSAFPHSCCAMMVYAYDDEKNADVLKLLVDYLFKSHNNYNLSLESVLDIYRFQFNAVGQEGYTEDSYELFPEAIYANNAIKAIEDGATNNLNWNTTRKIRELNYIAFEKLLKRIEIIHIGSRGTYDAIKGRQLPTVKSFPIYLSYFAKIALEKLVNNDELSAKRRKKYLAIPLRPLLTHIILSVIALSLVVISYHLDVLNTATSLLLSLAAVFFAPVKMLITSIQYRDDTKPV